MKSLRSNTINIRWAFISVIALAAIWAFFVNTSSTTAQLAPSRVAVIDVNKVLTQSRPGKAVYDKLKKLQDARLATASGMQAAVKQLSDTINTQRPSLTPARLTELTTQRDQKQAEAQRYAQAADKEIKAARDQALADLEIKIKPVIDGAGKEMGLAAIFNKFESGLIYASDAVDITDTIIKRFNEQTPATQLEE